MASDGGSEAALQAMRILEQWHDGPERPPAIRREVGCLATFEQERREVLEAVLESLAVDCGDADRSAACCQLLRHLARLPVRASGGRIS